MKSIIVTTLISLLLVGCGGQQSSRPSDPWFLSPATGRWQQGNGGTSINIGAVTSGAQASGIGKCEVVGGLAGAGAGALIGGEENRGIGAIVGAIVGAFAGNKYCEDSNGNVVPVGTTTKVTTNFSNEGSGAGVCRLLSDGTARLKAAPSQQVAKGQVLAVSEGGSATPKLDGEDCNAWRRRVASSLLYQG